MSKYIQLVNCRELGGQVYHVADKDAAYWGVYIGVPGDMVAVADFYDKELAYQFIRAQCTQHGYAFDDATMNATQDIHTYTAYVHAIAEEAGLCHS